NAIVGTVSFLLSKHASYAVNSDAAGGRAVIRDVKSWEPRGIYVATALSGLTALGAEVVWTRLLSLLFGATTYAFSVILAVFLIGLGIGSAIGSGIARNTANARVVLGWVQCLLAFAIAYGAWMAAQQLPYWPINPTLAAGAWFNFQLDVARSLFTMFPSALLWGASFPLAVAAAAQRDHDTGATVGNVYAANTFGAIGGSLLTGLVFVPLMGTHNAE